MIATIHNINTSRRGPEFIPFILPGTNSFMVTLETLNRNEIPDAPALLN